MIKESYKKELSITAPLKLQAAASKKDVLKLQSWIVLHEMARPGSSSMIAIDGDFGSATDQAVRNFQRNKGLRATGVADQKLFDLLSAPLKEAFTKRMEGAGIRELVVNAAEQHLSSHPFELTIKLQANSGPWVRAYMDGNEGQSWWWCMGFVQTIIDQAFSQQGRSFKEIMPLTYSCDTVGMHALNKGKLIRFSQVRSNPGKVQPGDIFLVQKSPYDWIHTGIITKVGNDTFETIEGNTNREGSANGDRVFRRIRNFRAGKLDVYSWE